MEGRSEGGVEGTVGALPNVVVIGAMKCATTALHHCLALHPDTSMSEPKELNFFVGPDRAPAGTDWSLGTWHRGPAWYAAHFDAAAPVRGESSPGYTSPSHPQAAARMAALLPGARLLYLVRDPVERAVSQYCHHRRDGTERRGLEEALLDPASQYVARSRYLERLTPFLATGAFDGRITVLSRERLRDRQRATLDEVFTLLGLEPYWSPEMAARQNDAPEELPELPRRVRDRLRAAVADDAEQLRAFAGADFPGWSV